MKSIRLREPFSGLSHLGGALLSIAGLVLLLILSWGKPWHLTSFSIYGASLITLFMASALYHLLPVAPERVKKLLVFDQVAIYLLIAGTYTPICLVALRGIVGWSLLATVWTIALAGIAMRIWWRSAPSWLCVALYVIMGWMCVGALTSLVQALPQGALTWLVVGGVLYSVGAVVFASQRPRLWPGKFGSHDLWHVFVLAGSASHFVVMACYLTRVA